MLEILNASVCWSPHVLTKGLFLRYTGGAAVRTHGSNALSPLAPADASTLKLMYSPYLLQTKEGLKYTFSLLHQRL